MPNQEYQQTLAQKVSYTGVGLHSGKEVLMTLCPAEVNTGIVFVRTDLPERPEIPAMAETAMAEIVTSTLKATTLSANGAEVFTVEHLMAALAAMQIDNCRIEMDSPEPPVTDGSAAVFCDLILQAGRVKQEAVRRVYALCAGFTPCRSLLPFTKVINTLPYSHMTDTAFPLFPLIRIRSWEPSILISS